MNGKNMPVLAQVKGFMGNPDIKKRFENVLGNRAPQFMSAIVSVVSGSKALKECDPNSIMAAAFVAAALDMPIDPNLGFAALVPYKTNGMNVCQFQMMYKGYVQLAIRTEAYERMNCSEVYEDELKTYNPITGECVFVDDFSNCSDRKSGNENKVVGYYAWFRLKSGFVKELYMSREEVMNHAMKYSKAFRYDQRSGKRSCPWSTNFGSMAKKTVLKLLLSRWGVLSIKLQRALNEDQKTFDAQGKSWYGDNQPDEVEKLEDVVSEPVTIDNSDVSMDEEIPFGNEVAKNAAN